MNDNQGVGGGPDRVAARIGIFRRVAVERYSQPLESSQPEVLAPWRAVAVAVVLGLCCASVAGALLLLA
jgi:hypothetical protein